MNTQVKVIDNYKKEFFKVDEEFRKELSRYNKLALQLSYLNENPELLSKFKSQHEDTNHKVLNYIDQVISCWE